MARIQAFREREKNTLTNKHINQSINTQSSNEKVLLLRQSPPPIDTIIDGERFIATTIQNLKQQVKNLNF